MSFAASPVIVCEDVSVVGGGGWRGEGVNLGGNSIKIVVGGMLLVCKAHVCCMYKHTGHEESRRHDALENLKLLLRQTGCMATKNAMNGW